MVNPPGQVTEGGQRVATKSTKPSTSRSWEWGTVAGQKKKKAS